MSLNVLVLIRKDPTETPQPVEALRIALGLSTGPNALSIVIVGKALQLITEDACDLVKDADILERYLPSIQGADIPIMVPKGSREVYEFDQDFSVTEMTQDQIHSVVTSADRVLVF